MKQSIGVIGKGDHLWVKGLTGVKEKSGGESGQGVSNKKVGTRGKEKVGDWKSIQTLFPLHLSTFNPTVRQFSQDLAA